MNQVVNERAGELKVLLFGVCFDDVKRGDESLFSLFGVLQ